VRVLVVTPYLAVPPDFGGASRVYHLVRQLATRHEIIALSLVGPGDDLRGAEAELGRIVPVPVAATARVPPGVTRRRAQLASLVSPHSFQHRFYVHRALQERLERLVATEAIDLVQFEFSQMGLHRVPGGVPSILDVHNVEHDVLRQAAARGELLRRIFNQIEYRKFRREEVAAWRRATACVATSAADAVVVERATGRSVAVVPNGVDLSSFPRAPLAGTDPAALVFVGAMRYRPNAEAACWFVEAVLPEVRRVLPGATLALVGADPPDEVRALAATAGVTVTGTVPDVRPWLRTAGTVVVPLLSGGGTRLKILEAFAAGRPVVSTTLGAAGLAVRDGEHLLIADTPVEFVGALTRLAADPELRQRLGDAAFALVVARYQWSAVAQELDAVYDRVAGRPYRSRSDGAV